MPYVAVFLICVRLDSKDTISETRFATCSRAILFTMIHYYVEVATP